MLKKIITAELKSNNIIDSKDNNKHSLEKSSSQSLDITKQLEQNNEDSEIKASKEPVNDNQA